MSKKAFAIAVAILCGAASCAPAYAADDAVRLAYFNACVAGGVVGLLKADDGAALTQDMAEELIAICLNASKVAADKLARK